MSTRTAPIEAPLSPEQSLLVDRIGNEVYASHYAERKAYRFIIACGTVVLLGSLGMNLSLARRPIANRYIRIDEMGRAQAIQYSDLNYSPREGEVRTYLTDWANYRYTINRDVIAKKYPLNYYFLSQALASRLMADDNANHLVSQVTAGQIESSDVAGPERDHHVHVRRDGPGRAHCSRHGPDDRRSLLLSAKFARAPDRALDAQHHLLSQSQTGQRPGQDLSAIRVHQSAGIDHHRVPRKPRLCRSHHAGNKRLDKHRSNAVSYELILPFFPEELRELLLDPSISDLMINGTTGVFADRNGVVEHIELANAVHERAAAGGHRARGAHSRPGPYRAESDPQYALAGWLARGRRRPAIIGLWPNAYSPQIQPLVHLG